MAEENEVENEVEVETNPIADLVQHSLDQDFNKANKIFGDIMGARINDILDQEKIKLSNQIYNGVEPGEDEESDEEQLELDLADEEDDDDDDDDIEDTEGDDDEILTIDDEEETDT